MRNTSFELAVILILCGILIISLGIFKKAYDIEKRQIIIYDKIQIKELDNENKEMDQKNENKDTI